MHVISNHGAQVGYQLLIVVSQFFKYQYVLNLSPTYYKEYCVMLQPVTVTYWTSMSLLLRFHYMYKRTKMSYLSIFQYAII